MGSKNIHHRMDSLANIVIRWLQEEIEFLGNLNKDYQIEVGEKDLNDTEKEFIFGVMSGHDMAIIKLQVLEERLKELFKEVNDNYFLAEKTNKEGYTYITKEGFVTWE